MKVSGGHPRAPGLYSEFETVPDLLAARAKTHGDRVAVSFEGEPCTYEELDDRVGRVHAWLAAAGVRPGQSVALLLRNSLEFLYAWLGAARAGAVSIPINTAMVGESLAYNLEHSDAVGLVADADLLDAVDAAGAFPALRWRVATGTATGEVYLPPPRRTGRAGAEPFAALLEHRDPPPARPDLHGGSPMSIVYTSGTTGLPKGVVLPHQSFTNTGAYFAHHLRFTEEDRLHTCLPLFHCNAQQCSVMAGLSMGIPVAINERFSLSRFWSWIDQSGATVTNLLGTMLTLLAKVPPAETDQANSLRLIVAAPVPEQLHRPLEARFGLRIVEGYGLTETGTMACINPVDDCRPGTIGLPLEHNELRIVDEGDRDLPDGTPGEILTRSRIAHAGMLGYFKEPEKTATALRGGWFHTGDLGLRRPDGYYVFLDRMKDTIRRRGENISSFVVEKAIADHPAVQQCAVFGVPSELGEEDVKVTIVVRDGAARDSCAPAEIVAWCEGRVADFMIPRYVEFRSALPLTETGRVQKVALRAEGVGAAWDRLAPPPQLPDYDELPVIDGIGVRHAWGVLDPNLGTIGLATPAAVVAAAALIRTGEVHNLDLPMNEPDPPLFGRDPYRHEIFATDRNHVDDRLDVFFPQGSSQWDGLRHVRAREHGFFGGVHAGGHPRAPGTSDLEPGAGALGIEHWARHGIVGRGVLLDVARYREQRGRPLDPMASEPLGPDDLQGTLDAQGVALRPGDIVCIRTGWIAAYRALDRAGREAVAARPPVSGLSGSDDMARWLWNAHPAALALDNPTVEVAPGDPAVGSLHRRLLPGLGFALAELLDLDDLAAACAADRRYEFFFVASPFNLPGGVGSPANALGIR